LVNHFRFQLVHGPERLNRLLKSSPFARRSFWVAQLPALR